MTNETTELARQAIAWAASENIPLLDWWGTGDDGNMSIVLRLDRRMAQISFTADHSCQVRLFNEHGRKVCDAETTDYRPLVREFLKGNRRTVELVTVSTPFTNVELHDLLTVASRLDPGRWVFTATEVPEFGS